MVRNCCVKGCKSFWHPNANLSLFRFPFKRPKLVAQWLDVVPSKGNISQTSVICNKHFKQSDFQHEGSRRTLRDLAVPSIFPSGGSTSPGSSEGAHNVITEVKAGSSDQNTTEPCKPNDVFADSTKITCPREPVELDNPVILKKLSHGEHSQPQLTITIAPPNYVTIPRERVEAMRRQIIILQKKNRQLERKYRNVTELIKDLKKQGKCTEDLERVLMQRFSNFNLELFKSEMNNNNVPKTRHRYTDKMKEFAMTVYFYSPKAYKFLRTVLHLPEESVLRKMIGETSCEPGFLDGVFAYLKNEKMRSGYIQDVGLIIDGMAIRSSISTDNKENSLRGYVDFGTAARELGIQYKAHNIAKEMLAFQIVSFSSKFEMPIAHFFIDGIDGSTQAKLIKAAIIKLHDVGITVRSLTCDGTSTNFSTLNNLGCVLELPEQKMKFKSLSTQSKSTEFRNKEFAPFFKHPKSNTNIYAILDPCHMLKLCRNALAQTAMNSAKGDISFSFIKNLHNHQEAIGLKYANKLTDSHINFNNKKMKVSLATQTISSGVADAIDFLRQCNHSNFFKSEATTEFIRIFDRLFDILNSRSSFGTHYKSPLRMSNKSWWTDVFRESEEYIRKLRTGSQLVINTPRRTFALGFIIDIQSFQGLATDLLTNIANPLQYFLTYKVSQDHIELYFCCLRSRGGWNNNPSLQQVLWSIRRLLYPNSIKPSSNANCESLDFETTPIFEFRSSKTKISNEEKEFRQEKTEEEKKNDEIVEELMSALQSEELSFYQENILYYIAGFIPIRTGSSKRRKIYVSVV